VDLVTRPGERRNRCNGVVLIAETRPSPADIDVVIFSKGHSACKMWCVVLTSGAMKRDRDFA
jgi:transketolase N-terminal domain/subunit